MPRGAWLKMVRKRASLSRSASSTRRRWEMSRATPRMPTGRRLRSLTKLALTSTQPARVRARLEREGQEPVPSDWAAIRPSTTPRTVTLTLAAESDPARPQQLSLEFPEIAQSYHTSKLGRNAPKSRTEQQVQFDFENLVNMPK